MQVHFVVHEAFEAPGAYEMWAQQHQYKISYSRVYLGEKLPTCVDDIDLLIVMGGPQSPSTTTAECAHFDSLAEQRLIVKAVDAGRAVIGVCLGSQLIGEALGAAFAHSPEKEIGKFPIFLDHEAIDNPKFSHFGHLLEVGHWHNDMPGLTPTAKIIARSEGCPRQIVEYSQRVYGFQCHMELTPEVVELLIENSESDLKLATQLRFVQSAQALRQNDYHDMNQKLYLFLDKLVAEYQQ